VEVGNPLISVILCTYNRARLLRSALDSLLNQSLAKSDYEVVVVDNASTDDTEAVVKLFQSKNSSVSISLWHEAVQGLGHARNYGYKKARGTYVAFVDDDCVAATDWLEAILFGFDHTKPTPWSVGGPILPLYESAKPPWFKDRYETDTWGDSPRFLKSGESFTGCNMSFRKDILETFGGFDVSLGMKGDRLALAEETELYRRMWNGRGDEVICYYNPRARIYHTVDPHKMTVGYQLKRAFSSGQASWAMSQQETIFRRLAVCAASMALILWYGARAILQIKPWYWQSWMVEQLYPVISNIGRLSAYLGIRMVFRQRHQTVICAD
jgi:glucosyl-dolichyl phosphate glucuronosyltransferase